MHLTSYSGSVSCPNGMALGGWYNLPGIPVRSSGGSYGGPADYIGLRITCRKSSLVVSCAQPEKPSCKAGHVVSSLSFNANEFKVGCCRLQSFLGTKFTPKSRPQVPYNSFEGYYCPVVKDNTGAMVYSKTELKQLGEPGLTTSGDNWTLSWDRFTGSWDLHKIHHHKSEKLEASVSGAAVFPFALEDATAEFSATQIRPLKASFLQKPKVEGPFPKKKPTYPKLKQFTPVKPDYKEYCSPQFLQQPQFFKGSISNTNPCYNTFNVELVQGQKGITESDFWNCATRQKARAYLKAEAAVSVDKGNNAQAEKQRIATEIISGVQLAGALIGMFPWGSYGLADATGAKMAEIKVEKDIEEAVERDAEEEELKKLTAELDHMKKVNEEAFTQFHKKITAVGQDIDHFYQQGATAGTDIQAEVFQGEAWKTASAGGKHGTKLVPAFQGDNVKFDEAMAKAEWDDCMPLQAGLSKVMCDLFCVQNSVRAGTTAVLQSLEDSHQVLKDNLQALLNYQSQYILWAMTQLPANVTLMQDAVPSVSDIMAELSQARMTPTSWLFGLFVPQQTLYHHFGARPGSEVSGRVLEGSSAVRCSTCGGFQSVPVQVRCSIQVGLVRLQLEFGVASKFGSACFWAGTVRHVLGSGWVLDGCCAASTSRTAGFGRSTGVGKSAETIMLILQRFKYPVQCRKLFLFAW